jgi:alanine-glyoxylate transaminase / serine-glyoxylate transaminase / serine-pyruvate transaminase
VSINPREIPKLPELMIAGPGELHDEDLEVLGQQVIAHYGDHWTQAHDETVDAVGRVLGAADRPYLIPGSGTSCLDAAVMNLFEQGEKVVVVDSGFFGIRLLEIARAHRLEVVEVPVEVGAPADVQALEEAAQGAAGILTVHVETATGVRHPVEEIAQVAHAAGAICVVDGIASVGGELMKVDEWGIDALITGTQKGLEAPPGLGILALGERGRARVDNRSERPYAFYLDLKVWDRYRDEWAAWHPHPVTMPSNLLLALASSLMRIEEKGIEAWVAERADLAKRCREGLRNLGLDPVAQAGHEANLVVAMWCDEPLQVQRHLLESTGIMVSGGLTPTHGKAIRVGLMGRNANEAMVDRVVEGVGEALASRS